MPSKRTLHSPNRPHRHLDRPHRHLDRSGEISLRFGERRQATTVILTKEGSLRGAVLGVLTSALDWKSALTDRSLYENEEQEARTAPFGGISPLRLRVTLEMTWLLRKAERERCHVEVSRGGPAGRRASSRRNRR